jgi:hypothetical protein
LGLIQRGKAFLEFFALGLESLGGASFFAVDLFLPGWRFADEIFVCGSCMVGVISIKGSHIRGSHV